MGKLYLATDISSLATRLAANLQEAERTEDFFTPSTIVVPNHYLGKWLRLWLARRFGIAINLRFAYLEEVMGELLRDVDPRPQPIPIELMDDDTYRLMFLAALLDERADSAGVAPLRDYLGSERAAMRRDVCRRAWHLAVRLAERIRDYEYHRRDMILHWLREPEGTSASQPAEGGLESSQRRLFQLITREPDGLRALLSKAAGKLLKTLPQYAGEIMEMPIAELATPRPRTVHIFGFTQVAAFHHDVLRCLGEKYDLRLYHLNPLISRLTALPNQGREARDRLRFLAATYRGQAPPQRPDRNKQPGNELLANWGQAGGEGLWLAAGLLDERQIFQAEVAAAGPRRVASTVLHRLQDQLLARPTRGQPAALPQDRSLQIVACPGIYREVETVYQSILYHLQEDAGLKQTDIGVLVTDMERYRPVVQAVFERQPRPLKFNIADLHAIGLSAFGHGVLSLLDLAQESFTRSRVFAVLLNPCFLARLGVEHEQALVWLDWTEKLGIYHGWDAGDKGERGYAQSPWYSWQLGLRRLRLGRLMEAVDDADGRPVLRFADVIPFADLDSTDKEQLDTFCQAVEGLLPRLARLRALRTSGENWAGELRRLIGDFLTVPRDRPEDQEVRRQLFRSLAHLPVLDQAANPRGQASVLPLALIREFVQHTLEALEGTTGEYLTGGVSIASLGTLLPVPFRILYILGLGEGLFPGTNAKSAFDLRSRQRCDGDIPPVEANRFLFLQALLTAQEQIYLLYNARDVQKDQELLPCSLINQLRRYLEQHVLAGEPFRVATVPLAGSDPRYIARQANSAWTDVFVNYNPTERLLAIAEARRNGTLTLDDAAERDVEQRLQAAQAMFELPAAAPIPESPAERRPQRPPTILLSELRRFLDCPAEAALRHHLQLRDDQEPEPADDEPFYTGFPRDIQLVADFLHRLVAEAGSTSVTTALANWRQRFADLHEEWRQRGRVPEEAFGIVDQTRFVHRLQARLNGPDGLGAFLQQRQDVPFCGPVLLGESLTPLGPRTRFPALQLTMEANATLLGSRRLVGALPFVWRSDAVLDVLILTGSTGRRVPRQHLSVPMLEPLLFFLALRAGTEAGADGPSAAWLGERTLQLHVAHDDGIVSVAYRAEDCTAAEARAYLTELIRDFSDRRSFDLLPFDLLVAEREDKLRLAYTLPEDAADLAEVRGQYHGTFQQTVIEDQEPDKDYRIYRPMQLLEIVPAEVPAAAFDKIRRRFRLLDRGPARLRTAGGGQRRGPDRS